MADGTYSLVVRTTAERLAGEWLRTHEYCDCAVQQQVVARRILPALAMYEREILLDTPVCRREMTARLTIYLTRAHDDLRRGLHRPGASATGADQRWRDHGNGTLN